MHVPLEELSEYVDYGEDLVTRGEHDFDLPGLAKVNVEIDRQMRELLQKLRRLDTRIVEFQLTKL
jgi:hypothetical protein